MAFPRFGSSFDGSVGFWQIGIRRIPVVGKIDSRYVLLEQGPFGTDRRDSIWKASGRIPCVTSFSQVDNETTTFCGFPNPTVPVLGPL